MRTIILSLLLICAVQAAAQERNYESKMTGTMFRGKVLTWESKKNSDGTYTDQYRDNEGNPLTEMERNFVIGHNKLINRLGAGDADTVLSKALDTDFPIHSLVGSRGESAEFQAWTGITVEQIRDIRLAQWDGLHVNFPPDDIIDLCVRAANTDDVQTLDEFTSEWQLYQMEFHERFQNSTLEVLSPQQIQKLWEINWAMKGDSANLTINGEDVAVNFASYKAFELNPEQQKKLMAMKQEFQKPWSEIHKSEKKDDIKALVKKLLETKQAVQTKIKTTVLTEAQRKKMEQLQTDKPKFLTAAAAPPKEEKDTEWMKSWKPGDPVPEGMLPPLPPSRFPIR